MAELAYKSAAIAGAVATPAAASGGGDTVRPNENGAVLVTNGDASAKTVTIAVPGNTKYGQADPDVAVVVAAGTSRLIGPLPRDLADPSDGLVHITYSAVTAVTVVAVEIV
jgi:hypothetical protein